MLRAAVCDDEKPILKLICDCISTVFAKENFPCSLFPYQSGKLMIEHHKENPYDILFLDICMPEPSGFELAKIINSLTPKTLLIFITSQDALVYNSLDYRPFHFVRKSELQSKSNELISVTKKLIQYFRENELTQLYLGVSESRTLSYREIAYIKSSLHYMEYHLISNEILRVRQKMSEAEQKVLSHGFIRIHRRYVVNLNAIERISTSRHFVRLYSGEELPVGKTYPAAEQYRQHLREMP